MTNSSLTLQMHPLPGLEIHTKVPQHSKLSVVMSLTLQLGLILSTTRPFPAQRQVAIGFGTLIVLGPPEFVI